MDMLPRHKLDELPDSPYARELKYGPKLRRFDGELEEDFTQQRLRIVRYRVRGFAALTFVLSILFSFVTLARDGAPSVTVVVHFALLVPTAALLLWFVLSRRYERHYATAAPLIAAALATLVTALTAESIGRGATEDLAIPPLLMIAIFMFMGLPFRNAAVTALFALVTFAIAGIAFGLPAPIYLKGLLLLIAAGGLAALISRDIEAGMRRRYLEDGLLNELIDLDRLTGLKNRRAFDEHLHRVWQHCMRDRRNLGVLFVDIDFFKPFNDEYGHQAGDRTLQHVAEIIRDFARRPLDVAARYGGEEFCVLLYDAAPADIADVAERLRRAVENLGVEHRASGCANVVTISIGVAIVQPEIGRSPAGALQLADEALYKAKESGRNRYEILGADEYAALNTGVYQNPKLDRRGNGTQGAR